MHEPHVTNVFVIIIVWIAMARTVTNVFIMVLQYGTVIRIMVMNDNGMDLTLYGYNNTINCIYLDTLLKMKHVHLESKTKHE